jgi:DNA-binding XRE family transcriptional regulator
MARIYRKTEYTPEERAEHARIRAMSFTPEGRAELRKTDGEPISSEGYDALLRLLAALRARREELGITQADLAERLGMDNTALCRLEAFKVINPTSWTLLRWAEALGCSIGLELRPVATPKATASF